jgi:hypothetical protein
MEKPATRKLQAEVSVEASVNRETGCSRAVDQISNVGLFSIPSIFHLVTLGAYLADFACDHRV